MHGNETIVKTLDVKEVISESVMHLTLSNELRALSTSSGSR
jgi:hypothetical protein